MPAAGRLPPGPDSRACRRHRHRRHRLERVYHGVYPAPELRRRRARAEDRTHCYENEGLELARCLALNPKVIICDEVFSGLSMSEIASMVPLVERLQMEGITLIMIEHRLRELFQVANRIMVLNFGEKLIEGTAEEVMADEKVKEAYFGSEEVEEAMAHA